MTPCRRVRNDQLATLKQHGDRRRSPSGLWSICVSGDRCGDAVGFSVSTRRQCNGRGQAERDRQKIAAIPASASILARSWHWARAAPPTVAARTRIVSKARIRRDQRKSVRPFKGIFCDDISEFESSHPSHAVGSLPANKLSAVHARMSRGTLPYSWSIIGRHAMHFLDNQRSVACVKSVSAHH
jgi:hypothetical protein